MKNKFAVALGKRSAEKRKQDLGDKFSDYMRSIAKKPRKTKGKKRVKKLYTGRVLTP